MIVFILFPDAIATYELFYEQHNLNYFPYMQGRSQLEADEAVASSDLVLHARRFTYFSPMLAGYS